MQVYDYLSVDGESLRAYGAARRSLEVRVKVGASDKPKDPFSAALDALRERLKSGRLRAGQPLTITDLAHDLGLSATPVREALSRLAGEGLIEDRRGRGYFVRRLDVSDLVELYGLRRLYVAEALGAAGGATGPRDAGRVHIDHRPDPDATPAEAILEVLDWVVASSGNRALFETYRQVCDRLAPAVRVEGQVFHLGEEALALQAGAADPPALGLALAVLHEERQGRAAELVRAMRAGENIASL